MAVVDEQALREAIDASLIGIALLDETGEYEYVNDAHVDVYGYDDESAFLGKSWQMCYTEAQLDAIEDVLVELERDGSWRGELEAVRADGEVFPQELSLTTLDNGGLVCVVRDVTERYEHERDLAALNEGTRGLMAAGDREAVADTVLDIAHRVLDESVVGVWFRANDVDRLEPVVATPGSDVPSLGDDARLRPVVPGTREWDAFVEGEPWFEDDYAAVPAGERANPDLPLGSIGVFPLGEHGILAAGRVDVNPFEASELDVFRVLSLNAAAALDRAERETALAATNERLDQFASVVSHDLRNPLSVIQGNAALAKETGEERYVDEVLEAADRIEHLVEDLLTLARQGETVGEPRLVSLASVADRAWKAVRTEDAELRVEASEHVRADPERLQTVFENLFRNAVEHGSTSNRTQSDDAVEHGSQADDADDGVVTVTVATDGDANAFTVTDDGPGIPPEDRERVFEHGYTTNQDGTGFGLAIVDRISTAHGWTVTLEAAADEGARFRFENVDVVA